MKILNYNGFDRTYFLILLPLFFVLHGFIENRTFVPLTDAALLALFYIFVILLFAFVFVLIFKNWRKAALFTFFLFFIQFFYGSIHDSLKSNFGTAIFTRYVFLLPCVLCVALLVLLYLKKSHYHFTRTIHYLNVLFLILIILDLSFLFISHLTIKEKTASTASNASICDTCRKPDVYLIIADEYPGRQALEDLFQFDNLKFENALQQRGFHTIKNSKSNYNFTPFSVASILNYNYLKIDNANSTLKDVPAVMELIKENKIIQFFSKQGYRIINNSFFELQGLPSETGSSFLPSKTTYITAQTLTSRLYKDIYFNFATRFKIKWVVQDYFYFHKKANEKLYNKTLQTINTSSSPQFSYTHLMMPHYPYFFNASGKENSFEEMIDGTDRKKYLPYLQWSNQQYLALFDAILKKSPQPPIIIFLSDHGFRLFNKDENRQYNFMNMCSIYLPDKNYHQFYDGLSNVNVFRLVMNTQFQQQLPLLRDSTIFLKD